MNLLHQSIFSFAFPSHHRNHRYPQRSREHLRLDVYSLVPGHVHHVQYENDRTGQVQNFPDQVKPALQRCCIDHRDHYVRLFPDDEIPGNFLFRGIGCEAVGAREVDDFHVDPVWELEMSGLLFYGLARPVTYVLVEPRQIVENRAFPNVRLARQRDYHTVLTAHQPSSTGSISILSASPLPRAISTPSTFTIMGPVP